MDNVEDLYEFSQSYGKNSVEELHEILTHVLNNTKAVGRHLIWLGPTRSLGAGKAIYGFVSIGHRTGRQNIKVQRFVKLMCEGISIDAPVTVIDCTEPLCIDPSHLEIVVRQH